MEVHQNTSIFNNDRILAWLKYFSDNIDLNLERVKIMDVIAKKKNVIPTVESNRRVLVFADEANANLFYDMWSAGLGECNVWFKEGLEPSGDVEKSTVRECINRTISGPTAILVLNNNARTDYKVGLDNSRFSRGSIRYVSSEIRSVIVSMLHLDVQDTACIISGESIAVEAAMIASEGTIIAVEYDKRDKAAMEDNVEKFGLHNVAIVDNCEADTMIQLPTPSLAFIVASPNLEKEIQTLLKVNPNMRFIIYTLELNIMCDIPYFFKKYDIKNMDIIQISLSKLNPKNFLMEAQPAPWIISGEA